MNAILQPLTIAPPPVTQPTNIPTQQWQQVWNTPTAQTALQLDITDTSSPAASLLIDLRVGGVSKFSVRKDGLIVGGGFTLTPPAVLPAALGADVLLWGGVAPNTTYARLSSSNTANSFYISSNWARNTNTQDDAAVPSWRTFWGGAVLDSWNLQRSPAGSLVFTTHFTVAGTGAVAVPAKVHIGLNSTQGLEANIYGLSVTKDVQAGGLASQFAFASELVAIDSTNDLSGAQHISGAQIAAIATSPANYHELWGIHPYATVSVGGTSDLAIGTYTQATQTSGTLVTGVGAEVYVIRTGGAMTNAIGLAVGYHSTHVAQGFDNVATNQYGIRVGPIINGTLNYAWYSEDGWMQIGDSVSIGTGVVPVTNARLFVSGSVPAVGGFAQGVIVSPTVTSTTTNSAFGLTMNVSTQAAAFTVPTLVALNIGDATKGAGSAITTQYGIKISDQTKGVANYAIYTGANTSHFGGFVEMTRWVVSDTQAAGTNWNARGFTDGTLYFSRDDISNQLMLSATALLPSDSIRLTMGIASQTWGKTYVGPSDFSNARGFLNVRADNATDNHIYLEDANGSPKDAWAIGLSTGGSFNGIGFYNYTAALQRFRMLADGTFSIFGGPITWTNGAATSIGTTDNFGFSFKTNANVRYSIDTSGNLLADTANGGYIMVRVGSSSVTAKVPSVLFESNNATTTSTTTATITGGSNGGTFTYKASMLPANGDTLRIVYNCHMSATTGTLTFTFGGQTILNAIPMSSNGTASIVVWITRRDATHFDYTYEGAHFNAATVGDLGRGDNVNVDLTTDQTVNFQGTAAAGTFTAHLCQIVHEVA